MQYYILGILSELQLFDVRERTKFLNNLQEDERELIEILMEHYNVQGHDIIDKYEESHKGFIKNYLEPFIKECYKRGFGSYYHNIYLKYEEPDTEIEYDVIKETLNGVLPYLFNIPSEYYKINERWSPKAEEVKGEFGYSGPLEHRDIRIQRSKKEEESRELEKLKRLSYNATMLRQKDIARNVDPKRLPEKYKKIKYNSEPNRKSKVAKKSAMRKKLAALLKSLKRRSRR